MSGESPEPNREQMTYSVPPQQSNSAPVGRYVPIAPTGFQERLGTLAVWLPSGASSIGGPQPTAGVSGAALPKTGKSVVVLKPCDVVERNGTVFMPNTIEMAQIKKKDRGQFKTNVQLSSKMTETDVKRVLVDTFPFLECLRFYCAAAADNRTRLDFHGDRRIWDGHFLKQKIKGNSALYIFAEEDSTGARQIEASGSDNQSLSASSTPIFPSIGNKSIKPSAACSNTGAHLGSVRTVAETATLTTPVHPTSSPSVAIENQRTRNAIPTSSICATQVSTQSMLGRFYEGYDPSSKKHKRAGNFSKHSKSNTVNRLRRKRSHTMSSSNSVPMSVSCPVASDQQSLEQPMSPVTGAITDTSILAAQMENLRFREKAGSSGKRVDNGAASRHDSQSRLLPAEETSELGGHQHKGWSLRASSCSFRGEQSNFFGQETLDDLYRDRVGLSFEELDTIRQMEINRQQEAAFISDPRTQGLTEGSDKYCTSSDINVTSSGICSDDDGLVSSDQNNSENVSQDQTEAGRAFEPEIDPKRVPFYKGADIFHIIFEHPPSYEDQPGRAIFESLGVVPLRRLNAETFAGRKMPPATGPCSVKVSVESESGRPLGQTEVDYIDDPMVYAIVLRHLASKYDGSNGHAHGDTSNSPNGEGNNGNTQSDSGSSGNSGFTQQLQSLQHLVNAAVASGARWFIEPIFKSSAGRMLLHSYKESSQLPEVIARKNGHEETANFLADITKRFSEETKFFPDDVQKIDWSELVFLVERAHEQEMGGIAFDQENYQAEIDLTIDTGYFGDVETSSSNSSPQSKSDSGDNNSEKSSEDSFEGNETQRNTDAFEKYSDEKADSPSPDLSDVNFPKEDSFEGNETQRNTDAFEKYSDEKADSPSPDLSDVNFPKEGASIMAYSDDILRYGSYGKEYEVPRRRVFRLSELQRGDHIAFDRFQGIYCHHAIVKHVDEESGEIKTIEYKCTPSGKFQVMEKTNRFLQEVTVYLMLHRSLDRDLVLSRAQSRIGEEKYNLLTNNCEHFAMWCITGRSEAKIAACSASHTGRAIMRAEVERQLVSKGAGMKGKLAVQSASHTKRVIMRTGMTQSMVQNELTTVALDAGTGVGGILAEGALAVAFEGLSMAYDIGKVYGDLKTRRIDKKGYDKTMGKRILTGVSIVAGSTIGMAAGQALIPGPAVGGAIGCLAGALVGEFVGNLTGNIIYGNDCEDGVDYYEAAVKKHRNKEIICCM